jgi:hypothetical protein
MRNTKYAANFTAWNFRQIIDEVEDIIDGDKKEKHTKI